MFKIQYDLGRCALSFLMAAIVAGQPALASTEYPAETAAPSAAILVPAFDVSAPITLARAWQLAEASNPTLREVRARLAATDGELADARGLLWNNPEIAIERGRRRVPLPATGDDLQSEWWLAVSQTLEIGGQQGFRRDAAEQERQALNERIATTQAQVRATVSRQFFRIVALQKRASVEAELVRVIGDAAAAARKRFDTGEDTLLDRNLADVELGRANNQRALVDEQLIQARAELAESLQWAADVLPEVQGDLPSAVPLPYSLDALLTSASELPRLRALEYQENAARSRLGLERAATLPDVTVGLFSGRDGPGGAREQVTGVSISLPLPLFRRNATGVGKASSDLTLAQIERQAAHRDVRAAVLSLWQRLDNQTKRVSRLDQTVVRALQENQRLSLIAYHAGEISFTQLLLAIRQVLDTRREVLDAATEMVLTRVDLEQASGWIAPQ